MSEAIKLTPFAVMFAVGSIYCFVIGDAFVGALAGSFVVFIFAMMRLFIRVEKENRR